MNASPFPKDVNQYMVLVPVGVGFTCEVFSIHPLLCLCTVSLHGPVKLHPDVCTAGVCSIFQTNLGSLSSAIRSPPRRVATTLRAASTAGRRARCRRSESSCRAPPHCSAPKVSVASDRRLGCVHTKSDAVTKA